MELKKEIETFEKMKDELEAKHMNKWVLIYGDQLISVDDSFQQVAGEAVAKFGRGPYLIRQVGAPPVVFPISVVFKLPHHG